MNHKHKKIMPDTALDFSDQEKDKNGAKIKITTQLTFYLYLQGTSLIDTDLS